MPARPPGCRHPDRRMCMSKSPVGRPPAGLVCFISSQAKLSAKPAPSADAFAELAARTVHYESADSSASSGVAMDISPAATRRQLTP
jgi:hypothetical protein